MTILHPTILQLLEQQLVRSTVVASEAVLVGLSGVRRTQCDRDDVRFTTLYALSIRDTFMSLQLKFSRITSEIHGLQALNETAVKDCLERYTVVTFPTAIAVTYFEVKSLVYAPLSEEGGCLLVSSNSMIIIAYIMLVCSETGADFTSVIDDPP
ncbi:hypothetical protein DXG01_003420 [Tephrocybe rancida]|nr:hypothetical protein DXG01_003420 [Tephrocybe rancida]